MLAARSWFFAEAAGLHRDDPFRGGHAQEAVLVEAGRDAGAGLRAMHFHHAAAYPRGSLFDARDDVFSRVRILERESFPLQRF